MLASEEIKIISDFKLLVSQKKFDYNKFKNLYSKKTSFIQDANSIITIQNSKLDNDGKEKGAANERILLLKNIVALIFEKARELEEICLEIETYRYNFKKEILINDDVNVVLEIEEKENIKDKILDGMNDVLIEKSLYKNILGLINDE